MTTGAPIYLVSACASGEQFVAAFRRYADRNGVVFVPIADPLPSGTKARFALTLKDGGVMVEGEAEVVSSARTPSVVYGRVGMTLKFLVPDEPSKTTLGELEKARLALKPSPPTIAPRPSDVPAEPRPTPPVPTGRIDSVNALAECVAIGEGLPAPGASGEVAPRNTSPKFAVPSVPSIPPARPKTPSTLGGSPPPTPGGSIPPAFNPVAPPPKKPVFGPDKIDLLHTMRGPPPGVDLTSTGEPDLGTTTHDTKPAAAPGPRNPAAKVPSRTATPFAPMPIVQQPAPPIVAAARSVPEVEVSEPTDRTAIPQVDDGIPYPMSDSTIPIEVPHEGGSRSGPMVIVAEKPADHRPKPREIREPRRTVMGVVVVPSGVMVLPAAPAQQTPSSEETPDTSVAVAQSPTLPDPSLPASLVNAIVEEPTPSGDWTMTPGVDGPTITRTPRDKPDRSEVGRSSPVPAPADPQTGDWMIALDPSQPDGWSEPSKVVPRPASALSPGPPVSVVSSARPLDSNKRLGTEPSISQNPEPKVQVDPALIAPLLPLPKLDGDNDGQDPPLPPMIPTSLPPMQAAPIPGSFVTPPARQLPLASASGANPAFDPPRGPSYSTGPTLAIGDAARRSRMSVIVASAVAVAVVVLGIILVIALGATDQPTTPPDEQNVVVAPKIDAGTEAPAVVDAAAVEVATPAAAPVAVEPKDCEVAVSSVPGGAEIVIGKDVVGTTPASLTLPCGVEAKLVLRKPRFVAQTRSVTPRTGNKRIKITLVKVTFSVKVSSTPPGASITVGTKAMGFTPTNVRLPAFEASTLTIAKGGFTADTHKVTPKANNQTVHATLKKLPKRGR